MSLGQVTSTNVTITGEFVTSTESSGNKVQQVEGRKLIKGEEVGALACSLEGTFAKLYSGGESELLEVVQNASPKLMSFHSESTMAARQTSGVLALGKNGGPLHGSVVVTAEKFIELMRNDKFATDTNYIVDSFLDLTGLQNVILPPSLHIKGGLRLGRKDVNVLPDSLFGTDVHTAARNREFILSCRPGSENTNLKVDKPEDTDISYLSDNLMVDGTFVASNCSKWLGFGSKTLIMGDCRVIDCENFQTLGKQFNVPNGNLTVCRCPGLKTLPDTFLVKSSVTLDKTGLISISENMKFGGSLNVIDCHDFKSIGSGVSVGSVFIKNCKHFEQWPVDMMVQESIRLADLHGVMVFPGVLKLDGDLNLSQIRVKLPNDLSVGRDLIMTSTDTINLYDDLQVKVKLNIDLKNTPMKYVPSWLSNCFEPDSGLPMPHHVFLEGTGLARAGSELEDTDGIIYHFDDKE
ncbi:hypothetical protein [Endozoicomonas sp. SESOKO1]|uniref:hypothetical protein n=1 Tax=Endozoicomonas sp. SESOKO1 TaxID=2828742 RepID=UPI0021486568|nr:hypothetical protein [Endozoicomonas sp. SESOKO1]